MLRSRSEILYERFKSRDTVELSGGERSIFSDMVPHVKELPSVQVFSVLRVTVLMFNTSARFFILNSCKLESIYFGTKAVTSNKLEKMLKLYFFVKYSGNQKVLTGKSFCVGNIFTTRTYSHVNMGMTPKIEFV